MSTKTGGKSLGVFRVQEFKRATVLIIMGIYPHKWLEPFSVRTSGHYSSLVLSPLDFSAQQEVLWDRNNCELQGRRPQNLPLLRTNSLN